MTIVRVSFVAGDFGDWAVEQSTTLCGDRLPDAAHVHRVEGAQFAGESGRWQLRGVRSNDRYVEEMEKDRLAAIQPDLGRDESICAALIPIKKSDAWWKLPQDARRAIFEQRSQHIAIGLQFLPAVARRLYHCRDLGEPFDFLTWFEFSERDRGRFDELVALLRASEEWRYVEREVDLRLRRVDRL